ncbi:hypothetical protein H8A99_06645 [Bradyrhizobium sp. Arg68]|nr:hypothetical protein [Bradyrhizobium ivorense]
MVRAIEDQARQRGFSRLNLYTSEATGFYARLGWSTADRTNWRGVDAALMVRDLRSDVTGFGLGSRATLLEASKIRRR